MRFLLRPQFLFSRIILGVVFFLTLSSAAISQQTLWNQIVGPLYPVEGKMVATKPGPDGSTFLLLTAARQKMLVVKLDINFQEEWRALAPTTRATVGGLDVDESGDVYVATQSLTTDVSAAKFRGTDGLTLWRQNAPYDLLFEPEGATHLTPTEFWAFNTRFDRVHGTVLTVPDAPPNTEKAATFGSNHEQFVVRIGNGSNAFVRRSSQSGHQVWGTVVPLGGGTMKNAHIRLRDGKVVVAINVVDGNNAQDAFVLASLDQAAGSLTWSKRVDAATPETINDLETDSTGALVMTGSGMKLGQAWIETWKFEADGDLLWQRSIQGGMSAAGHALEVSASDEIFVAGHAIDAAKGQNGRLIKFVPAGLLIWIRSVAFSGQDALTHLYLNSGNVIVGGYVQPTAQLKSAYVARFTASTGLLLADEIYEQQASFQNTGISRMDPEGNVYWLVPRFPNGNQNDVVDIRKVSPDGVLLWQMEYDDNSVENLKDAQFDSDGNLIVLTFALYAGNVSRCTVLKIDAQSGELVWSKKLDPSGREIGSSEIAMGKEGDVYVQSYESAVNGNTTTSTPELYRLDSSGAILWTVVGSRLTNLMGDAEGNLIASPAVQRFSKVDGSILWQKPVPADKILMGNDGVPVAVEGNKATKLRLSDGETLWTYTGVAPVFADAQGNIFGLQSAPNGITTVTMNSGSTGDLLWSTTRNDLPNARKLFADGGSVAVAGFFYDPPAPIYSYAKPWIASFKYASGGFNWKSEPQIEGSSQLIGVYSTPGWIILAHGSPANLQEIRQQFIGLQNLP